MGNGKDDQPKRVRVPESRDSFACQWQRQESIQEPDSRAISETLRKRSAGQLRLKYQRVKNGHQQTRDDVKYGPRDSHPRIAPFIHDPERRSETMNDVRRQAE
jgi:hypothetical protein